MKPVIRCSELSTLLWCPGSRVLGARAKRPTEDTSQAAAGKWCHARGAERLRDEESATGPAIELPPVEPSRFLEFITGYWVDTVRMYVEPHMAIEYEAEMEWEFARFILKGHLDMFAIDPQATEFVIGDLKSGPDPVTPAEDNAQLLGYDVLAALNYPTAAKGTSFICQPLLSEEDGLERVTVSRAADRASLEQRARYLEREINNALDHPGRLVSSWKPCHYCPAALICPAFEKDLANMILELTPEQIAAIPSEPSVEKLYRFEAAKKQLEAPFKVAHETLKERVAAMGGAELADGTKLFIVDRPGAREITDNAAATAALQDLPDPLFHLCYKFRPGAIEEVLAEHLHLPKTSKKGPSGQSAFKDRLGHLVKQGVNKILSIA
jgi:hypothetical protein